MELPALMYVSEVTLGPLRITPVTEATNARKSVAFSDLIASKPARVLQLGQERFIMLSYELSRNRRRRGGSKTKLANSSARAKPPPHGPRSAMTLRRDLEH